MLVEIKCNARLTFMACCAGLPLTLDVSKKQAFDYIVGHSRLSLDRMVYKTYKSKLCTGAAVNLQLPRRLPHLDWPVPSFRRISSPHP